MGIRRLTDYNKVGKSRGVDDQLCACIYLASGFFL